MKIEILSDLHLTHHKDMGKSFIKSLRGEADVLIIAGDLTGGNDTIYGYLKQICDKYKNTVFVLGNHCYYGSDEDKTLDEMEKIQSRISNLYWLENRRVNINGINFIGATLWFESKSLSNYFSKTWSDFRCITGLNRFAYKSFEYSKNYFANNIKENDIVITHHTPSYMAVDEKFEDSPYNIFFHNSMEDIILQNSPAYWVFGHTHNAHKFEIGNTKLVCNPLGYPSEGVRFTSNYTVEV